MPQLAPSYSKAFYTANMLFFLAAFQLKAKNERFMKGMVSHVTCEKVLKAFSREPCVLPTGEPVGATR